MCALKALLCMIGKFLHILDNIMDMIESFKDEITGMIDSALALADSLVTSVLGVVNDLSKLFGFGNDLCAEDSKSFMDNVKDEMKNFVKSVEDQFIANLKSMINSALSCKFQSPKFNFGRLGTFSFGFSPNIPPTLNLKIPSC
jgi:prophage DNA circulation protein